MKKNTLSFAGLFLLAMALNPAAWGQSYDTLPTTNPNYYYDSNWYTFCPYFTGEEPGTLPESIADTDIYLRVVDFFISYDNIPQYLLRKFHTKYPLTIKGLSCMIVGPDYCDQRFNEQGYWLDYFASVRQQEYLYVCQYDSAKQCMTILDSVPWDYSKRKVMLLDRWHEEAAGTCYAFVCETPLNHPVTVEGDFYLAGSTWSSATYRPYFWTTGVLSQYAVVNWYISYRQDAASSHRYHCRNRDQVTLCSPWLDSAGTFPPGFDSTLATPYSGNFFYSNPNRYYGPFFPIIDSRMVELSVSDSSLGRAWPSGRTADSSLYDIYAQPTHRGIFAGWSDGDTHMHRTIFVTQDTLLTALFIAKDSFYVSTSADSRKGSVIGGGYYFEGDTATVEAVPLRGHRFVRWDDDSTCNPRTFVPVCDTAFTAYFADLNGFNVEARVNNEDWGRVRGTGTYYPDEEVQLMAIPADGYAFSHWGDGSTLNRKTFMAERDTILEAYFYNKQGIEAAPASEGTPFRLAPNPARGNVALILPDGTVCHGSCRVAITDAEGRTVLSAPLHEPKTLLDVSTLAAGIYYVTVTTPAGVSTQKLAIE